MTPHPGYRMLLCRRISPFSVESLLGQQEIAPRWKRCTRATDNALGEAVGQDWVKQYFSPEKKENMDKLVTALDTALATRT